MNAHSAKKEPLIHAGHVLTKIGLIILFVAVCFISLFAGVASASDEVTGNDLR